MASEKEIAQTILEVGLGPRYKMMSSEWNGVGKPSIGGDSPVHIGVTYFSGIQSTARHVEPCRNQRGPSRKAKYSLVTDSEQVP